ncbi:hypothetical protein TNCV_174401 [Trichonephila clavipes]|nr:hypothetical protein TNCV_174401 [Trichonephila clavipes]
MIRVIILAYYVIPRTKKASVAYLKGFTPQRVWTLRLVSKRLGYRVIEDTGETDFLSRTYKGIVRNEFPVFRKHAHESPGKRDFILSSRKDRDSAAFELYFL